MDEITTEQIAQNYSAMGDSVAMIEHLELMVAQSYWTDQSMTAVNAAITAGKAYTAS